jgi:AraC family transcriptional regulator of adaptative response/methylated-DNA-[protein]-cysteine methyltransferase
MFSLPSFQIMYNALVNRDSSFEGIFYAGIRTTGIFCRPTCPARKPFIENVEFFPSTQAALAAGYRPCIRCRPLDLIQKPQLVEKLLSILGNSDGHKLTNADLKQMGIDPSTASRQFKQTFGMSFQSYQRSHQMGKALDQITRGEKVIMTQVSQGYSSASGFWAAFRNVLGEPPSRASNVKTMHAAWLETPLGPVLAIADDQGLYYLNFADHNGLDQDILALRRKTGSVVVPGDHPMLLKVEKQIKEYFSAASFDFSIPLVMSGSPFENSVWSLLKSIPPGHTLSYQQVAEKLGQPHACRAVGNANGRNKLLLVIPCHRVVRADGTLGGYGGGVWRKRWLLEHERNRLAVGKTTE